MVQILPQATSYSGELGRSLKEGISSGLEQGSQVGFQRGLLQNSLEDLKNLSSKTTPGELAQKLMFATAGIPGAEKYFQPLYQTLLSDIQSKQKAEDEARMGVARANRPELTQDLEGSSLTHQGLQNVLGEKFFPSIQPQAPLGSPESLKPQKPLMPPEPIGPAEEAKIRKKLREAGITDPGVLDQEIAKIKDYQNDFYNAQKEGFQNIKNYQEARRARDDNFFKNSSADLENAHGTMSPPELSIWKELSRQYEALPDTERFASTEELYNALIGNPVIQFENNVQGLPPGAVFRPGEVKQRMDFAKNSVKSNLDKIDKRQDLSPSLKGLIKNQLRNQYFTSMAAKEYGIAQAAYATADISPETRNIIPKIPAQLGLAEQVRGLSPEKKERYIYNLANALTKIKPEDSLILIREQALKNNYDDNSFRQALNLALNSGRLTLSDFQSGDLNKLSIPQRLNIDSILEGKRSVWDVLKGKK